MMVKYKRGTMKMAEYVAGVKRMVSFGGGRGIYKGGGKREW